MEYNPLETKKDKVRFMEELVVAIKEGRIALKEIEDAIREEIERIERKLAKREKETKHYSNLNEFDIDHKIQTLTKFQRTIFDSQMREATKITDVWIHRRQALFIALSYPIDYKEKKDGV